MTDTQNTLVFYTDKRKGMKGFRLRMLFIALPLVIGYAVFAYFMDTSLRQAGVGEISSLLRFCVWFLAIEIAAIAFFVKKGLKQQAEPIITLSLEGIRVHAQLQNIGFIAWDEVADARAYTLFYRYVGIVPKDTGMICRRAGTRRATTVWLNEWCIRLIYRPLRIFVAPINIPQEHLPISADELMEHIRAYQAAHAAASGTAAAVRP